ncbi:MAG: proteasome assembly chaperone family protein [Candidatus Methanomethylophilaceae archaeon]|jgi:uncharacterized protein (TIGR00162 family)
MESIVRYDFRPELSDIVFIEGLPGIGNVGKIAADHLAEKLNAKRFACIYSPDFPPQVTIGEDGVADFARNELWHAKAGEKDIVFLLGDYQGSSPEGQFLVCHDIMEEMMKYDLKEILTLGGYGTGGIVTEPRVFGAVSRIELKEEYEKIGVTFEPHEPKGGIVGASAMFLAFGQMYKIDSVCLMGETSGYFIDHKSASEVLKIVAKRIGVEVDMQELDTHAAMIDELNQKVKELENSRCSNDDLGYIG